MGQEELNEHFVEVVESMVEPPSILMLAQDMEDMEDDLNTMREWLEMEVETNQQFRREVLAFLRKHYKGEDLSDLCSRFGE